MRISSHQSNKLIQELNDCKEQISSNNVESEDLKKKIQKLYQENTFLNDENRNFQENIRLSNVHQQKILNELN